MNADDLALGMRLHEQAGWNQSQDDWQRMLALGGDGCFVAEQAGVGIGTTLALAFGDCAWIAMVLVDEAARGQGVGRALLQHAIAFCEQNGITTLRLDATASGGPLYRELGFEPEYEVIRFGGQATGGTQIFGGKVAPPKADELDELIAFDRDVAGCDRSSFLRALHGKHPSSYLRYRDDDGLQAYLHQRAGSHARQLGPCLARNAPAALAVLNMSFAFCNGQRIYVDIPAENSAAVEWAADHDLHEQRRFTRMRRGPALEEQVDMLWASSGPEKG